MLADGEAEDAIFGGEAESVDGSVVRDLGLLGDREFLELIWLEDRLWRGLSNRCRCWCWCRCLGSWGGSGAVGESQYRSILPPVMNWKPVNATATATARGMSSFLKRVAAPIKTADGMYANCTRCGANGLADDIAAGGRSVRYSYSS